MSFAPGRMPPAGAKPSWLDRAATLAFPQNRARELRAAVGLLLLGLVLARLFPGAAAPDRVVLLLLGEALALAVIIGTVGAGLLAQQQNTARSLLLDGKDISSEVQEFFRNLDLATAPPTPTDEEAAARADLEIAVKNFRARPFKVTVAALNVMDGLWARWELMVQNNESEILPNAGLRFVTDHWMKETKEQLDRTWAALETGAATLTALGAISAGLRRTVALSWVLVALLGALLVVALAPAAAAPLALAGGYLTCAGVVDAVSSLLADRRAFEYDVTLE